SSAAWTKSSAARCCPASTARRSTSCAWMDVSSSSRVTAQSKSTRIATMFEYEFMRNAFVAGGIVAIVGGAVGVFLVLRSLTFAGHALSHVGLAGATGAVLVGLNPHGGLLPLTLAAGIAMGVLGERLRGRDGAIVIRLPLAL